MVGRTRAHRSLVTVLFVDIVDSTRVASDVGDQRWRELVGSFRRAVRRRLKAEHGKEQDTAGDGFFATFDRPAAAIRAAVGVMSDVHALGLDARCGIHTGELEWIDGRFGGIAAHIGARVMAQAEPAEVLVTATVHDLVVGSGVAFDDPRDAELKGVPGKWTLHRVAAIDGTSSAPPLDADKARAARLSVATPATRRPRLGPRARALGLGVAGAFAIVALGAVILTLPPDNPSFADTPTPSGVPTPVGVADRPPSMVKIDAATNEVVLEVVDRYLPVWEFPPVYIVDGVLWQDIRIAMVRRDVLTGEMRSILEERLSAYHAFPAFGSIWLESTAEPNWANGFLSRIDPISGRELAVVNFDEPVIWSAFGRDGIHVLTQDEVLFVDPDANAITDRDPHGLKTVPDAIVSVGGHVWICECEDGRITEWDADADAPVRTIEFAQRGFFLEDQRELSQGSVSTDSSVVWLKDEDSGTITPVDTATGEAGQPIGIPRDYGWHVFGLDAIWIGAKDKVLRIDLETRSETSIPLPEGFTAGGLAIDEATGAVWVSNYVPRGEPIPEPLPPEPSERP